MNTQQLARNQLKRIEYVFSSLAPFNPDESALWDLESTLEGLFKDLEAAERERDELRAERDGAMESALAVADAWVRRAKDAEAELARRDAAAGEPFGYVHKSLYEAVGSAGLSNDHEAYRDSPTHIALYTAAPPAVLPELDQDVKNIIGLLSENEWAEHCTKSEMGRTLEGEITRLHDLRAQQQKVVVLPDPADESLLSTWQLNDAVINALDAANVKWEVRK